MNVLLFTRFLWMCDFFFYQGYWWMFFFLQDFNCECVTVSGGTLLTENAYWAHAASDASLHNTSKVFKVNSKCHSKHSLNIYTHNTTGFLWGKCDSYLQDFCGECFIQEYDDDDDECVTLFAGFLWWMWDFFEKYFLW